MPMEISGTAPVTIPDPLSEGVRRRPPWSPNTAAAITFLFGPFSGALITALSLQRMGNALKARWVFGLGVAGTIAFVILLNEVSSRFVFLAINLGLALLFRHLQTADFEAWQAADAFRYPASGWRAAGWGVVGLALFLVLFLAVLGGFSEAPAFGLSVSSPTSFTAGEKIAFSFTLRNPGPSEMRLYSLDLGEEIGRHLNVTASDPPYVEREAIAFGQGMSYIFRRPIPPGEDLEVRFQATVLREAPVRSQVSVCIDTAVRCTDFEIELPVQGEEASRNSP
jgi:hypothetical protein